ncbi:hypothetical protein ncot_14075 [Nocardioides sp. JQ2195]|uniref:hypothetical protein n=1 Tax=Nocardioides sp. JQ2195 TaxID=2592334 RepID=UPI00143E3598|nr:hypothetical protein [Nocardioides sp. JQ2195]QIX27603.1 hypothetical protein ncot_14075 [Nocardioides sp. JQ2195]
MDIFTTGAHVAVLDPMHGAGIVVAPLTSDDLRMGGPESLHAADWTSLVRRLADSAWTFLEDDWEDVAVIAHMPDGRKVHGLYPLHVATSDETPTTADEQDYALRLARLVTTYAEQTTTETRD